MNAGEVSAEQTVPTVEEPPSSEPQSISSERDEFEERRLAVEFEVAKHWPEHPWAAEYSSSGTDTSDTLWIAPEAGYAYRYHSVRGVQKSWGRVDVIDGVIILQQESPGEITSAQPERLVPVRWGARRYLLREWALLDFCNRVNSGREDAEPTRPYLACRRTDALETSGKPDLPQPFRDYVFETPLTARVKHVLAELELVVLDVGRSSGAFVGMRMFDPQPKPFGGLVVVSVDEAACEAKSIHPKGDDLKRYTVGFELTSRR